MFPCCRLINHVFHVVTIRLATCQGLALAGSGIVCIHGSLSKAAFAQLLSHWAS